MYHGDPSHSGRSTSMPNVSGSPKVIESIKLDGAVYASPIAVDGMIVVATENDSVYAFDAHGQQFWHVKVGRPSPAYERACGDIDPLGITGTPIYSAQTGDVYVVAEHNGKVGHDMIALDLHAGKVQLAQERRPARTDAGGDAAARGAGHHRRAGLGPVRRPGRRLLELQGPRRRRPARRQRGPGRVRPVHPPPGRHLESGGPAVDPAGHLFVVSANGSSFPGDAYDHTNSVLELSPSGELLDSFAPTDWAQNNQGDVGLGSQGVALVGTKWAVLGGKSGPVYVLRQGHLGGIGGQVSVTNVCLSFGGAAVDGSVVYLPCTDGVRAVRVDSAGKLHVLWHASGSVAGSPVVGGGRVWALDYTAGVLHALDPATGQTLGQVAVGQANRFATPAIYGSLVLVPTLTGVVFVRT